MKKLLIITICIVLLAGTLFVGAKIFDYEKIKDIKEIKCEKIDGEKCKDKDKIKLEDDDRIKIELVRELNTGKEFQRITVG